MWGSNVLHLKLFGFHPPTYTSTHRIGTRNFPNPSLVITLCLGPVTSYVRDIVAPDRLEPPTLNLCTWNIVLIRMAIRVWEGRSPLVEQKFPQSYQTRSTYSRQASIIILSRNTTLYLVCTHHNSNDYIRSTNQKFRPQHPITPQKLRLPCATIFSSDYLSFQPRILYNQKAWLVQRLTRSIWGLTRSPPQYLVFHFQRACLSFWAFRHSYLVNYLGHENNGN